MLAAGLSPIEAALLYGAGADQKQLARTLGGDIDVIIATALKREPQRRYPTAAAFAADLRRWLEGQPISARADSSAYRFAKFVRRHRLGVAASALIALSLVIGLGAALYQTGQARQQAALAERQAARAERITSFLISLFDQNDPARSGGTPPSAADILARGRAKLDKELADDPEMRGELLTSIAKIQDLLGDYAEALATIELAVPLLAPRASGDASRLAQAHVVRSEIYYHMDRSVDAEKDMRSARAIFARAPIRNADRLDDLDRDIAYVLRNNESAAAAVALETQVIERMRKRMPEKSARIADHRLSLAVMLEEDGRYDEAEAQYRIGLPLMRQAGDTMRPNLCEGESNFAGLLDRVGKSAEAAPYFERALACRKQLYGSDSAVYARTLFSRGILWLSLYRYDDAQSDFIEASKRFGESGNDAGHAHRYLGLAQSGQKRYREAAAQFAQAERIYRAADVPNDVQRWRARADYGYAIFKTGDVANGQRAIESALAGLDKVRTDGETFEYLRPLNALGEVARAQHDLDRAVKAHRRAHALASKLYGADSKEARQSGYQLGLDLAALGDAASLEQADPLVADAVSHARASGDPALADYERAQRDITLAQARLPGH